MPHDTTRGGSKKAKSRSARFNIRWVLAHDPISVFEAAAKGFAAEVSRETDGELQVEVLTNAQFGAGKRLSPATIAERVSSGDIQMCQTYTSALGRIHEPLWALDLPFLFKDHGQAAAFLDGENGAALSEGLLASRIRGLAYTYSGGYRMLAAGDPGLTKWEDLKGLRVRTGESPVAAATFETLGAVPVPAPLDDVLALAKEGRIDAAETTFPRYWDQRQYEAHRSLLDTGHSLLLTMIVIHEPFFRSLSAAHRAVVRTAAANAARSERARSIEQGLEVKRVCGKNGIRVVTPSAPALDRMARATDSVYKRFPSLAKRVEAVRSAGACHAGGA